MKTSLEHLPERPRTSPSEEAAAWREHCIAAVAGIARDSVIFSHYVAINVIAGAALGDDRVVVFSPDNCSVTVFETDGTDLKLIEKQAKAAHLDLRASFQPFIGVEQLQEAIGSGAIDMAPFGTAPLLAAWQRGRGTDKQIFAVSGITSLPNSSIECSDSVSVISPNTICGTK